MRVHFTIILTVAALLVTSNAAVPSSASVPGEVGTPNKRSLRSYNMYDLDQEDTESEEERASINVSKLDDLIDAKKLDDVVDPKKISGLLNAKKLDDLVDAKKIDELIDSKKIDELMDPAKTEAALTNVDDQISLFSKWIATPGTEKAVVARLPVNTPEKLKKNMPILKKFNDFRTNNSMTGLTRSPLTCLWPDYKANRTVDLGLCATISVFGIETTSRLNKSTTRLQP
ncbi:unnamed protein product [Phytophthora lilii]|uniref:RxLR effector protein n=1 Tax=Phytophthora lilii TaxID=2077276 RepID=A0A9W6XH60_9STRA|nr:unnamed protein product [Phytophthora lilii]